jgi:hypothetical protein
MWFDAGKKCGVQSPHAQTTAGSARLVHMIRLSNAAVQSQGFGATVQVIIMQPAQIVLKACN